MSKVTQSDYIVEINNFFSPLSAEQQAIFFYEIKKIYKQKIELEMLGFELPADITLDEIVAEVRAVRSEK